MKLDLRYASETASWANMPTSDSWWAELPTLGKMQSMRASTSSACHASLISLDAVGEEAVKNEAR
jgi:hypothetical protein